jgi:hypothetical protein
MFLPTETPAMFCGQSLVACSGTLTLPWSPVFWFSKDSNARLTKASCTKKKVRAELIMLSSTMCLTNNSSWLHWRWNRLMRMYLHCQHMG